MPTPVVAGALSAALAGAAAKSGFGEAFAAICASLFFGLIVWQSKEFKEASMSLFSKTYYYLMNSAIIFVIAIATLYTIHYTLYCGFSPQNRPASPGLWQSSGC